MSRTLELPDELYRELEKVALEHSLTVVDWIAATLPEPSSTGGHSLPELLQGLIGAVDSTEGTRNDVSRTSFGDLIARKLEKQGLRRP
jgi:hypothetical protein